MLFVNTLRVFAATMFILSRKPPFFSYTCGGIPIFAKNRLYVSSAAVSYAVSQKNIRHVSRTFGI